MNIFDFMVLYNAVTQELIDVSPDFLYHCYFGFYCIKPESNHRLFTTRFFKYNYTKTKPDITNLEKQTIDLNIFCQFQPKVL